MTRITWSDLGQDAGSHLLHHGQIVQVRTAAGSGVESRAGHIRPSGPQSGPECPPVLSHAILPADFPAIFSRRSVCVVIPQDDVDHHGTADFMDAAAPFLEDLVEVGESITPGSAGRHGRCSTHCIICHQPGCAVEDLARRSPGEDHPCAAAGEAGRHPGGGSSGRQNSTAHRF